MIIPTQVFPETLCKPPLTLSSGNYALVGPGWNGDLPKDVQRLDIPTDFAWILGRTQTNGPSDYDNVHQIQQGYKLIPLTSWGKPYTPPVYPNLPDPSITGTPIDRVRRAFLTLTLTLYNRHLA